MIDSVPGELPAANQCRTLDRDFGARNDGTRLILNLSLNATCVLLPKDSKRRAEWSEDHRRE